MDKSAIEELFSRIQTLSRPEVLDLKDENLNEPELLQVYNDGKKAYEPIINPINRTVSDVESFISVTEMEAKRRNVETGKLMTIYVTQTGGILYPCDTKLCKDSYIFKRKLSDQWELVSQILNRDLTHRELLAIFRKIKPSMPNFAEINSQYTELKFMRNFELTSSPQLVQGKGGEMACLRYQIANGNEKEPGQTELPVTFELEIPYAKAGKKYILPIEIIISVSEHDQKPVFTFVSPELETVEEQAIKDETDYVREKLSSLTDLYIHNNF